MIKQLKKEVWNNLDEETRVILVLLFSYIFKEQAEYIDGDPNFFVWENSEWSFDEASESDVISSHCGLNVGIEGYHDQDFYIEIWCRIKKNIVNCYGREILDNITDFKSYGFGDIPEKEDSLNIIKLIFAAQLERRLGIDLGAKQLLEPLCNKVKELSNILELLTFYCFFLEPEFVKEFLTLFNKIIFKVGVSIK